MFVFESFIGFIFSGFPGFANESSKSLCGDIEIKTTSLWFWMRADGGGIPPGQCLPSIMNVILIREGEGRKERKKERKKRTGGGGAKMQVFIFCGANLSEVHWKLVSFTEGPLLPRLIVPAAPPNGG